MYAVQTVLMNKKKKGMNLLLNKDEKNAFRSLES